MRYHISPLCAKSNGYQCDFASTSVFNEIRGGAFVFAVVVVAVVAVTVLVGINTGYIQLSELPVIVAPPVYCMSSVSGVSWVQK